MSEEETLTESMGVYTVYVKITALGESIDDALDYVYTALDKSDLLDQDGIVGLELDEESIDTLELEDEDGYGDESDTEVEEDD
jgi:hypothetical protein